MSLVGFTHLVNESPGHCLWVLVFVCKQGYQVHTHTAQVLRGHRGTAAGCVCVSDLMPLLMRVAVWIIMHAYQPPLNCLFLSPVTLINAGVCVCVWVPVDWI